MTPPFHLLNPGAKQELSRLPGFRLKDHELAILHHTTHPQQSPPTTTLANNLDN